MIKKVNGGYVVYGENGIAISRPFATQEKAEKRLQQIEHFKQSDYGFAPLFEDDCCALSSLDDYEDAEYKGKSVTLNTPFRTPNESKKFAVYVKNPRGNVIKVRFGDPDMEIKRDNPANKKAFRERHNCSEKSDKTTPGYWSCKMWSSEPVSKIADSAELREFHEKVFFDFESKRLRSVRDGVQEYAGLELGAEPYNKMFSVYRSPESIANLADLLDGLPITNDHVDVDDVSEVDPKDVIGMVRDTEVLEFLDDSIGSTLLLENSAALDDRAIALSKSGKKEFSLGYMAKLIPHDKYDFEQIVTKPTHLALVDSARGGSVLTFVDKRKKSMSDKPLLKAFLDDDGNPSLQQIVEIAQELPEALKKIPVDKLQEVIPVLQEIISMGGATGVSDEEKATIKEEGKAEMMDADIEEMEDEEKEKFEDSNLFKSIIKANQQSFADSKAFADAVTAKVDEAVKANSSVIEKAVQFVGESYSFADKSTNQIMRDALATEHGDTKFEDAELSTAFKMLKKSSSSLMNFGDGKPVNELDARIEKELEG